MERKKNWNIDFRVYPANTPGSHSTGPSVVDIRRDWIGITRTQCITKAFRLVKSALRRSKLKYPRLSPVSIFGRLSKSGPWRSLIRARHAFAKLADFTGITDPWKVFVAGYGHGVAMTLQGHSRRAFLRRRS